MWEKMMDWLRQFAPLQYRLPQVAVVVAPFLAQHYSESPFIWPPLGGLETYAAYPATLIIFLFSFIPVTLENKQQAKSWVKGAIAMACVTFVIYAFLFERYVISEETPANGIQTRSVGFRVEPPIRALYPDKNNSELLRIGGLEDWQIQKVWTPGSVLALRLSLLITLILTLGLANVALGAAAQLKRKG
ncbi:MAG TPA: hypothetical protein VK578_09160 [Edaphobacter sp.]|nr:hypothetical protein [Edaphobacter sp.]